MKTLVETKPRKPRITQPKQSAPVTQHHLDAPARLQDREIGTALSAEQQDCRRPLHHPHDFTTPAGITFIASSQVVVAAFLLVSFVSPSGPPAEQLLPVVADLLPLGLLLATGVALGRRRPWGWWNACAIFYFGWIQACTTIAQALFGNAQVSLAIAGPMILLFTIILAYLNSPAVIRAIHFPSNATAILARISPAGAGLLLALLLLLPDLIRP